MSKIITLTLDEEVVKKLRVLQAKRIRESSKTISLSKVANEVLKKNLR